jgi:hypothetical protein
MGLEKIPKNTKKINSNSNPAKNYKLTYLKSLSKQQTLIPAKLGIIKPPKNNKIHKINTNAKKFVTKGKIIPKNNN